MTIRQCLGSLFYIHNETVNILTHGESATAASRSLRVSSRVARRVLSAISIPVTDCRKQRISEKKKKKKENEHSLIEGRSRANLLIYRFQRDNLLS